MNAIDRDPFDLGFDGEHHYEIESWRPSADYPEVTRVVLRREGRVLVREWQAPHATVDESRWTIDAVHAHIGRATLVREGFGGAEQFDLVKGRFTTEGEFIVPMKTELSSLDRGAWAALLRAVSLAASRVHPTIGARELGAGDLAGFDWPIARPSAVTKRWEARTDVAPDDTSWMAAQFGLAYLPPPPPGVGLSLRATEDLLGVDAWAAEGSSPLLTVGLVERTSGAREAYVRGMLRADTLARVDAAVGELASSLGLSPRDRTRAAV